MTRDFKTTFTSLGTCYTFNHGTERPLFVNTAGSGFALSLVLNIEQYEYMRGARDEAGIKVSAAQSPIRPYRYTCIHLYASLITTLNWIHNGWRDYTIEWFSQNRCQQPLPNCHTAETAEKDGGRMTLDLAIFICL